MYTIRRHSIDGEVFLKADDVVEYIINTLLWIPETAEEAVAMEEYIKTDFREDCYDEDLYYEYTAAILNMEQERANEN